MGILSTHVLVWLSQSVSLNQQFCIHIAILGHPLAIPGMHSKSCTYQARHLPNSKPPLQTLSTSPFLFLCMQGKIIFVFMLWPSILYVMYWEKTRRWLQRKIALEGPTTVCKNKKINLIEKQYKWPTHGSTIKHIVETIAPRDTHQLKAWIHTVEQKLCQQLGPMHTPIQTQIGGQVWPVISFPGHKYNKPWIYN